MFVKDRKEKHVRESELETKKKKNGNRVIALIIYLADVAKGAVRSSRIKGEGGRASEPWYEKGIYFLLTHIRAGLLSVGPFGPSIATERLTKTCLWYCLRRKPTPPRAAFTSVIVTCES